MAWVRCSVAKLGDLSVLYSLPFLSQIWQEMAKEVFTSSQSLLLCNIRVKLFFLKIFTSQKTLWTLQNDKDILILMQDFSQLIWSLLSSKHVFELPNTDLMKLKILKPFLDGPSNMNFFLCGTSYSKFSINISFLSNLLTRCKIMLRFCDGSLLNSD